MSETNQIEFNTESPIRRLVSNSFKFRLFLLWKLPLAWFARLRVDQFDAEASVVSVPYGYLTKNPFRSMYFAPLTMAAELASGLHALDAVKRAPLPVGMLVIEMKASFLKKATSRIYFKSNDAQLLEDAVKQCIVSGERTSCMVSTTGIDDTGSEVAKFWFTWTFKQKQ